MTTHDHKAQEALDLARFYVSRKAWWFESMVYMMTFVQTEQIPTMATSESMVCLYNPKWIATLKVEQAAAVIVHEIMHIFLKHSSRRVEQGYEPKLWNVAADCAINCMLVDGRWELPKYGCFPKGFGFPDHLTADEYYDLLRKQQPKQNGQGQQGQGQGQGGPGAEQEGDGSGKGQKGQGKGKSQPSQGAAGNGGENGNSGAGNATQGAGSGVGCGSCVEGGDGEASQGEQKAGVSGKGRSQGEIETAVVEAANAIEEEASRSQGTIPAGLLRAAKFAKKPAVIPWQQELARSLRHSTEWKRGVHDYDYSRPHRRMNSLGGDVYMPAMRQPIPRVDVIGDTSGSMGTDELERICAEFDGILRTLKGAPVGFFACDAEVHAQGRVTRFADLIPLLRGGGGSNLIPGFDKVMAQKIKPSVIVAITDGMITFPEHQPKGVHVIIVLVGPYAKTPPCKWGKHIFVNKNQAQ